MTLLRESGTPGSKSDLPQPIVLYVVSLEEAQSCAHARLPTKDPCTSIARRNLQMSGLHGSASERSSVDVQAFRGGMTCLR